MKTGQADLPLHYGKAPRWLFERMVKLGEKISEIIILEYGEDEFLRRLAEPYFFQSFGCVLGFDWHSSGLTTTTCGALKLGLKNCGIKVAGGKGKTSKKTPEEIRKIGDEFNLSERKINDLIKASKLAAKIDNNMIQDSYSLYHHSFFISEKGKWCIVQQGLRGEGWARRYHWLSDNIKDIIEYEKEIVSQRFHEKVLNLTTKESKETRKATLDLIKENPAKLKKFQNKKLEIGQKTLSEFSKNFSEFKLPRRHEIEKIDLGNFKAVEKAYEVQPRNYEELLLVKGIGAKTLRALSLISSLIYGTKIDWKDPAKFSFAHGGKDGIPYPVNKELYDKDIEILSNALKQANLKNKEKLRALERLRKYKWD